MPTSEPGGTDSDDQRRTEDQAVPTSRERERERAKRRLAVRQAAQSAATARHRARQQVLGAVVTLLVVVGGVVALSKMVGAQPATSPTSAPGSSATTSAVRQCPRSVPAPGKAQTFATPPPKTLAAGGRWDATLTTTCGVVKLELYGDKAPQTVSSFLFLARHGFYDRSPCHRLTTSTALKVLQCGDPTGTGTGGPGYGYGVENVPKSGRYPAGTLAMARGEATTSNGSQFFIAHGDSTLPTAGGGYSVFGKVTGGLDILRAVAAAGTNDSSPDGAPARAISIERIAVSPR